MDGFTQGRSHPIGATLEHGGANFCLFSRTALAVELLLFDGVNDTHPSRVVSLDPLEHRTYHYWHVFSDGRGSRSAVWIPGPRPVGPFARVVFRCFEGAARSLWTRYGPN